MHAQTNLQLYRQLIVAKWRSEELSLVRAAYDLSRELFVGCYRPSQKHFVAHLVGTASALAAWGEPSESVDRARTLPQTLPFVLAKSRQPETLAIVDDGSNEACNAFAAGISWNPMRLGSWFCWAVAEGIAFRGRFRALPQQWPTHQTLQSLSNADTWFRTYHLQKTR